MQLIKRIAGRRILRGMFLIWCIALCSLHIAQAQTDSIGIPVRLSSFQGNASGTTVTLRWTTVCFLSYAYFQVQRSADGKTFTTVHSFAADKVRCQQPFEWKDTLQSSANIFYRVNVGDVDGKFSQSKVVSLISRSNTTKIIAVYPTVVYSSANIVLNVPDEGSYKLNLVNAAGTFAKQYQYALSKGTTYLSLDISNVSKGIYWLALMDKHGSVHTVAINKQ